MMTSFPRRYAQSIQAWGGSLKVFERVPKDDIRPVRELLSGALSKRTWRIHWDCFGFGSRISVTMNDLLSPFHLTHTLFSEQGCPWQTHEANLDNFLPSRWDYLPQRDPHPSLQKPPHFSCLSWVSPSGHKQCWVLCVLFPCVSSMVVYASGHWLHGGAWSLPLRKDCFVLDLNKNCMEGELE